ncbi:hypothetical protein JCM10296v2_007339 [Rhodotorula toruloides]
MPGTFGRVVDATLDITEHILGRLLELGWIVSKEKLQLWSRVFKFSGLVFDLDSGTVGLLPEKAWKFARRLQLFLTGGTKRTLKEVLNIVGTLMYLSTGVPKFVLRAELAGEWREYAGRPGGIVAPEGCAVEWAVEAATAAGVRDCGLAVRCNTMGVVLGWQKGRSTKKYLNRTFGRLPRKCEDSFLFLELSYVPTKDNPADGTLRGVVDPQHKPFPLALPPPPGALGTPDPLTSYSNCPAKPLRLRATWRTRMTDERDARESSARRSKGQAEPASRVNASESCMPLDIASTTSSGFPTFVPNLVHNQRALYYVKSTTACIAGSVAGILGLTNLHGFVLFFITSFGVGALYSAVNCGMKPSRYLPKASEPLLSGTLGNCFSSILFWTLFYSLVHIYK